MSISALLVQGLQLMLMGMGFVFVFLGLLVAAVTIMSRWIGPSGNTAGVATAQTTVADPELIAVISTVVHKYRQHLEKVNKSFHKESNKP